jgi:hypothetical protein
MNAVVIVLLFCCGVITFALLAIYLITFLFRYACVLCGLPKPSMWTAFGMLVLIWICKTVAEAIMKKTVDECCQHWGIPPWEGWLITFFLFLPIDLLISASLHAAFMGIRIGKGIEVWFVQMLMLGAIIAAIVGVAAIYLLAAA